MTGSGVSGKLFYYFKDQCPPCAAIPKANSLFSFTVSKILFTLRGTHLKYRPGDRSARKFKEKPLTTKDIQY